jgi:hypothetical protein
MKLSDYFPDQFEGWETAGEPKNTMQPMVPNDQTVNTPYLRATIPLTFQYQMDSVKQWNTMGLSNFRIAPVGPNGIAAQNAAAQSAVTTIINNTTTSGGGGGSTFVPSIPVNVQNVENYLVKLADLSTLDTFTNDAGGTIVLPGASLPAGTFSGATAENGFGASVNVSGPATYAGAVISVINTESDLGSPNCTPTGMGWVAIDSAQNGNYASVYSKLIPAGTFTASYSLGTSVVWVDSLIFFGNCNIAPVAVQPLNIFSGGTSGTQSHSATFSSSVTAGHAILVVVTVNAVPWDGIHNRYNYTSITASDGVNSYGLVGQGTGGNSPGDGAQQAVFLAQNVAGGSTTITVQLVTPAGFANGGISATAYEINLGTATPIPSGFPAGWFCYIENSAPITPSAPDPIFVVKSPAEIDGQFQTISLGPNEGVIVAFDGTNWWTERGVGGGGAPIVFPISIADGGTGTSSPGLIAGSGITITGAWPDQTIAASGGSSTPAGTPIIVPAPRTAGDSGFGNQTIVAKIAQEDILVYPTKFKVSVQLQSGASWVMTAGVILRTAHTATSLLAGVGGLTVIDSTPITWGGSATPTLGSGENVSDDISLALDTTHDYWFLAHFSSTSGLIYVSNVVGVVQSPGIGALYYGYVSGDHTADTTMPPSLTTTSGAPVEVLLWRVIAG